MRAISLVCCLLFIAVDAWPYSVPVHQHISTVAFQESVLHPAHGNYLSRLGLTDSDRFKGNSADQWIVAGSAHEDDGARALNHFYDPETGNALLNLPGFIATTAVNWGLELQTYGTLTQDWAIPDARSYFYQALRDPSPTVREDRWARTFRAIGHVVHLVQDMAQPQHVRNDPHYESDNPYLSVLNFDHSRYERYTGEQELSLLYTGYPAVNFDNFISYWDAGNGSGLAEVTNHHFFSERYTISCNVNDLCTEYNYDLPAIVLSQGHDETQTVPLKDGTLRDGIFTFFPHSFIDPITGETVTNPRVLSSSLFDLDLQEAGSHPIFSQNDFTFEESQKILIQRAVGYSAGLINYFFRGQLEVIRASGGLQVKNMSTEVMSSYTDATTGGQIGAIEVFYDYRDASQNEVRQWLATSELSDPLAPGDVTSIIPFNRPQDNIKPGRYIVVFRGKLGQEDGAVIGTVTAPDLVYFVSNRAGMNKIYSIETNGANQTIVYDNPDPNLGIGKVAPSPDGKTLAFTVNGPRIYLLELATGALSELTNGDWPDWSPDGKRIAFHRDISSSGIVDMEIFVRELATGVEKQLTKIPGVPGVSGGDGGRGLMPAYSPDGSTIAYVKWLPAESGDPDCINYYAIYLMTASGASSRLSCDPNVPWIDTAPSWSPDGQEIAFSRRTDAHLFELHKISIANRVLTKLTNSTGSDYAENTPAWSPDGTSIAVGSKRDGDFDIWLVDPSGGGYVTNLTNDSPAEDAFPAYLK